MAYTEIIRVMLYLTAAAVATELILWVWCYRSPAFKSINEQVEKTSRKMDAMKASGRQKSAKQRSLADRMEKGIKREAAKEMAVFRFKQSLVVCDTAPCMLLMPQGHDSYAGCCPAEGSMLKAPAHAFQLSLIC